MKRTPPRRRQRGAALWLLLVLVLLTGSYAYYRSSNLQQSRYSREGELNQTLAKAKEALIAYAVVDLDRPGRFPCPDTTGSGNAPSIPSGHDCPAYQGYLPWKTLDLQEAFDKFGVSVDGDPMRPQSFFYIVARYFSRHREPVPLNSDTPGHDVNDEDWPSNKIPISFGSSLPASNNPIVAVIIAAKGSLDSANTDGDSNYLNGSSGSPNDNDIVLPIYRSEVMAAVERRIAREVNNCLEQHASSAQNTSQTYPWPAPLAVDNFKGTPESLFGMVPNTQPGNPDEVLKRAIADLKASKISLESASTAGEQLTALQALQSQAAYARAFFDSLYIAALNLNTRATETQAAFDALDTQLGTATSSSSAFSSGFSAVIAQIPGKLATLASLQQALADSGLDLFVMAGDQKNRLLGTRITTATLAPSSSTFNLLLQQDNLFRNTFLPFSSTPNPEIAAALGAARTLASTAATDALAAKQDPSSAIKISQALASSEALRVQNNVLLASAIASRYNIAAGEFTYRSQRISLALGALGSLSLEQARNQLLPILEEARNLTDGLSTGAPGLLTQRTNTLNSLDNAVTTTRNATDFSALSSSTQAAAIQLTTLGSALLANGENVAAESLSAAGRQLQTASGTPPTTVSGGASLRDPTQAVAYWAEVAKDQSADVARQARRGVSATNDSTTSAYTAARQFLAKLDGDTGAIFALESHIAAPSDAGKAATASRLLADASGLLATLINRAETLESTIETGLAQGVIPTVWFGNACKILSPPTGSNSWWQTHAWNSLVFYQLSDRIRPAAGRLTVNGQGTYRTVTLSAGTAINPGSGLQNRSLRETRSYLEGRNTHVSRDGSAKTPVTDFENTPPSATFNDRLAY